MTHLVVGLGNPGPDYARTRHNVGFHVVERVAAEKGLLFRSASSLNGYDGSKACEVAATPSGDAVLVKPTTFMNRSGQVVGPLARHLLGHDASPAPGDGEPKTVAPVPNLLVVVDDLDLPLGRLRIRPRGGSGGQNGMRSIIEHLGTDGFPRLRVGIGHPGTDAARHVLTPFSDKEQVDIDISVVEASEAILAWLDSGDLDEVMTRFHSRWNQDDSA